MPEQKEQQGKHQASCSGKIHSKVYWPIEGIWHLPAQICLEEAWGWTPNTLEWTKESSQSSLCPCIKVAMRQCATRQKMSLKLRDHPAEAAYWKKEDTWRRQTEVWIGMNTHLMESRPRLLLIQIQSLISQANAHFPFAWPTLGLTKLGGRRCTSLLGPGPREPMKLINKPQLEVSGILQKFQKGKDLTTYGQRSER